MAIRSVVLRGFGNGTFNGTIPLVVTRGYAIGDAAAPIYPDNATFSKTDASNATLSRTGASGASFSRTGIGGASIGKKT